MKTQLWFIALLLILSGCKTYNYFPPSPNNAFFANQGEVHAIGDLGVSGVAFPNFKGGVGITDNVSLIGTYGGGFSKSYSSSEGEFGIGFNTNYRDGFIFGAAAGYGLGNNTSKDSGKSYINFSGTFTRPFFQFSLGVASGISETSFTLKFDYITYSGQQYAGGGNYTSFTPVNFYYEPYFSETIGGQHVRFEAGLGFAIKPEAQWGDGMRICPFQFNLGLYILLNRKSKG